ncbi:MAG: SDR family NAD(P)-dependent oxidoreductase [Clostridia bacterium]|nr:SDR family NAD(P)-dependent oxidoreductase [Clostridia bacterium]
MNIKKWIELNSDDLCDKTAVITGATGGLGKQLCLYLAGLNANLVLACRNQNKTENLIKEIKSFYPNCKIDYIALDLENMDNVKLTVEKLKTTNFDFLIHNSGIYNVSRKTTTSGIDNIFQVNFVAPYYITKELLPHMRHNKAKVIAVGSIAHNYSKIDENDIEFKTRKKSSKVYGNSKRFFMFALYELFKKETNAKLAIVHPGVTLTNITNHYHKSINWLVKLGMKIFFPNTKKATLHLLKGVFENSNYLEWFGPTIFSVWGKPKKRLLKTTSKKECEKIFEIAENYYNKLK